MLDNESFFFLGLANHHFLKTIHIHMLFPSRLPVDKEYLTAREAEVLWYCAQGLTALLIADKLSVSAKTVERHKENIRTRFGLTGHHSLYQFAHKWQGVLKKWVE